MAKQIIWTKRAQDDRKEILYYWQVRNQSNTYSRKLNELIKKAVKLVAAHPYIGRRIDIENVRVKLLSSTSLPLNASQPMTAGLLSEISNKLCVKPATRRQVGPLHPFKKNIPMAPKHRLRSLNIGHSLSDKIFTLLIFYFIEHGQPGNQRIIFVNK